MTDIKKIGFIGTGVMGGRMCRNLSIKGAVPVIAFDLDSNKVTALDNAGVEASPSIEALVAVSDLIIICVPGEPQVRSVLFEPGGVLEHVRAGQTVVDMTTATADVAREAEKKLAEKSVDYADAPIARGVSSAEDGTLSIMVGGTQEVFNRINPAMSCMGTEVTHCGGVGTGMVMKLMNNFIVFMNTSALAEALLIGTRAGVDGKLLFETLSRGSADSFVLRKHGMQYMVKEDYPDDVFSVVYSLKDLSYALKLAEEANVNAETGKLVERRFKEAIDSGYGPFYGPVVYKLLQEQN